MLFCGFIAYFQWSDHAHIMRSREMLVRYPWGVPEPSMDLHKFVVAPVMGNIAWSCLSNHVALTHDLYEQNRLLGRVWLPLFVKTLSANFRASSEAPTPRHGDNSKRIIAYRYLFYLRFRDPRANQTQIATASFSRRDLLLHLFRSHLADLRTMVLEFVLGTLTQLCMTEKIYRRTTPNEASSVYDFEGVMRFHRGAWFCAVDGNK